MLLRPNVVDRLFKSAYSVHVKPEEESRHGSY